MRSGQFARSRHLIFQTLLTGFLLLACGFHAIGQESQMQQQETAALDRIGPWKLINTGIFVALLAWFLAKYGPRFFNARSADIMKAIKDSTGLKIQADFRYSEIDRKMASLPDEVKRIREQADIEMQREHDRIKEQTEAEIKHMRVNASN
ncbi:MAG: ATP synthase F0 subunit B, partial [Acidobacteriota bacterium]|nr:ATP synthase F0 subunit B [Acidobacteriota bacterium]